MFRAPCRICNACARLPPPFESYSTSSVTHRPPVSTAPNKVRTQPLPCSRRARTAASHIRLRRAQRGSALCDHLLPRQPAAQRATARPPRRAAARFEAASGRLRAGAQRPACWRRARTPLHVSAPQAHLTRALRQVVLLRLCMLSRCAGAARHGTAGMAGCGGPLRACSCACAWPGACRGLSGLARCNVAAYVMPPIFRGLHRKEVAQRRGRAAWPAQAQPYASGAMGGRPVITAPARKQGPLDLITGACAGGATRAGAARLASCALSLTVF